MKRSWPELLRRWKGALEKYRSVLLVMAVGALLLLLPWGGGGEDAAETQPADASWESFDLEEFEDRLEDSLSQIAGAGKARVILALESGSRQVLAQDVERGSDGESSTTVVTVGAGSGSQDVVSLQTVAPRFRGALVVCPGGEDPVIRLRLTQAVSALTGLSSDRISVCAGNT